MDPGCLVRSVGDLYCSSPIDGDAAEDEPRRVGAETVGIILAGPNAERKRQYHVQFLNNVVWWVNAGEIEPYNEW
jgi:hypothetical protein